ncbi:penicillin-binding protein 1C [Elusimicrobium posterum]|uniref:penicillin-binding protein 1C n=1 Tax=Elusimicrobium posterum TaxID=3116653 RepID=UPI003C77D093
MKKLKKLSPYILFLTFALLLLCFSAKIFNFFSPASPLKNIRFSQAFYAADNELLRLTLSHDDKYRLFVSIDDIPKHMQDSLLMYEDRYFYYHYGVNPLALARSFWATYIQKSRRMGASTITMQTARMLYNLDTYTISGKLKQMFCALWLEVRYTKKQILETYFNLAPYSYNIEGIGAASLIYFNTRTQEITPLQAMTLTVVPQNPNKRNPSTPNGYEEMKAARNKLFAQWIKKFPKDKELEIFFNLPMNIKKPSQLPFKVPHIINYLAPRAHSPEVFTTIKLDMQEKLETEIEAFLSRNYTKGMKNSSAVLLNYKTMEVEAAVGSADFWNADIEGQVIGFNSKRLAGSTLKTYIFGMAVEQGLIHPATLLKDTKRNFGIYSPENSDRAFAGPILAEEALTRSRNIPAIELLMQIGYDNFVNVLKKGGVTGLKNGEYYSTGLALGAFEISPYEAAALYAALANRGIYKEPTFIRDTPAKEGRALLTPEAAFIALNMLKDNQRPYTTPKGALTNEFPVYFKTGTSSSYKDSWTAGVFEDYALVVWVGNFNGEGNRHFLGRSAALPLFFNIVKAIEKTKPGFNAKPLPENGLKITMVDVCKGTGDLPGKFCPETFKTHFIPGVSPIKVSEVHRQVLIDRQTGLRACKYDKDNTEVQVYEFWPSEIEELFRQAGIIRKTVPKYVPDCTIEEVYLTGNAPEILLPTKDIIYSFRESDLDRKIIPLKAQTDADASKVFWFVGDKFMGTTNINETLFMEPKTGRYQVKAIDDLGRASVSYVTMMIEAQH